MRFDLLAGEKPFRGGVNGFEGLAPSLFGNEFTLDV
jgi:hypothetical protein